MNRSSNQANFSMEDCDSALNQLKTGISSRINDFKERINQEIACFEEYIFKQNEEFRCLVIRQVDEFTTLQAERNLQMTKANSNTNQIKEEKPLDLSNISFKAVKQLPDQVESQQLLGQFKPSENFLTLIIGNSSSAEQLYNPLATERNESVFEPKPNILQQNLNEESTTEPDTSKYSSKLVKSSKDSSKGSSTSNSSVAKIENENENNPSTSLGLYSNDRTQKKSRSRSTERNNRKRGRSHSSDSTISISSQEMCDFDGPSNHFALPKGIKTYLVKCISCQDCGKDFKTQLKYEAHFLAAHNILPFQCPQAGCDLEYRRRSFLKVHLKSSHRKLKEWKCKVCGKKFKASNELSKHANYAHLYGQYQCTAIECKFVGRTKCEVIEHFFKEHCYEDGSLKIEDVSEINKKDGLRNCRYKYTINMQMCPVKHCDFKCYSGNYYLRKHLTNVHGFKPHRCSGCDLSFNFKNELSKHTKRDHTADSWRCSQCSSVLINGSQLNEHNIVYHYRGNYRCTKQDCHFSANLAIFVINHYDQEHGNSSSV